MFEIIFLIVLALIWIIFATIQDIRTREVANWLNFSLIIFALGFRFFYSLFESNWNFLFQGLIGFGIFFILGNLFYYMRIFAGGDAKLLISLGAVIPFSENLFSNFYILAVFLFLFLFAGAVYGLVWSFVLTLKNFKNFRKEFFLQIKKQKKFILVLLSLAVLSVILGFFIEVFFYLAILIFISPYLFIFAKAVENSCMVKLVSFKNLREGDWLAQDIQIGNKKIKANWEGLSLREIEFLKKHKKLVKIKNGIPFVPVFLISFLILIYLWSLGIIGRIGIF